MNSIMLFKYRDDVSNKNQPLAPHSPPASSWVFLVLEHALIEKLPKQPWGYTLSSIAKQKVGMTGRATNHKTINNMDKTKSEQRAASMAYQRTATAKSWSCVNRNEGREIQRDKASYT